jgi:hypothetical protein
MSWECDNHGGSRRDYLDHIESINAELAAHLHTATDLYRPPVRALQLVHTDDPGHWPPGSRVSRRPARARNLLGGMCVLMIERMFHWVGDAGGVGAVTTSQEWRLVPGARR